MNCQLSKLVIVLPRYPSAVTFQVVAGIQAGVAALGISPDSIVCVRNVADAARFKSIDMNNVANAIFSEHDHVEPCLLEPQVVLSQLAIHGVRWIVFIGGKHEAQSAWELSEESAALSAEISIALIPDDFTNSLPATDHCLGFGSFALSFCDLIAGDDLDNYSFFGGVKLLIAPGAENGWTAAAAGLAAELHALRNTTPDPGPHLIYVPEKPFCETEFRRQVNSTLAKFARATVVVSKSLVRNLSNMECSDTISALDGLRLSEYLMSVLRRDIQKNKELVDIKIRARIHEFRTMAFMGKSSETDSAEAFNAGIVTTKFLIERSLSCFMLSLKRKDGDKYSCDFVPVEIQTALFYNRPLPEYMIPTQECAMSQAFLSYILPLVGVGVPAGEYSSYSFSTALSAAVRRVNSFANARRLPRILQP